MALGDRIEAHAPAGAFTIDARQKRPAVLLAGGIGITPILAMLRHVVYEGLRTRGIRPTTLFYAAHSKKDRAFDKEIAELVDAAMGAVRVVRVLGDTEGAEQGRDYDAAGRIDMALLSRYLPLADYDFYVCGPSTFTQALYDGLRGYNVADNRIHTEAFGPSSLVRTTDVTAAAPVPPSKPPSTKPVPVIFTESLKEARWAPESGSLLDLAEERGLSPPFSCRMGTCGSCRTKLVAGDVTYLKQPTAVVAKDEVLICCAVPASQSGDGEGQVQLAL
jgi:ferredoxin-NADP reductase